MNGVHQEILAEENTHVCMHTHIYTHTIVYRIHICTNEIVPFAWIELQIIVLNARLGKTKFTFSVNMWNLHSSIGDRRGTPLKPPTKHPHQEKLGL